jgi:Phage integrase family
LAPRKTWSRIISARFSTKPERGPAWSWRLAGLCFHDLRHHAITELAESQASDGTIMSIAGHVSNKMLQHYSHIRLQAKGEALDALVSRPKAAVENGTAEGFVTNLSQSSLNPTRPLLQMIEKNGGPGRDRTRDLIVANYGRCLCPISAGAI